MDQDYKLNDLRFKVTIPKLNLHQKSDSILSDTIFSRKSDCISNSNFVIFENEPIIKLQNFIIKLYLLYDRNFNLVAD